MRLWTKIVLCVLLAGLRSGGAAESPDSPAPWFHTAISSNFVTAMILISRNPQGPSQDTVSPQRRPMTPMDKGRRTEIRY